YRVTLRRSALPFIRQLLSPLLLSLLCAALLLPVNYMLQGGNIFMTIAVKVFIFLLIFGTYIQITKEYDIIEKGKTLINLKGKFKN
ncbi:MAG: lipopolysaccharide biosynthesis protein, partial [Tannerellaceae bacterium]